jgi:hypothetical protein
MGSDFLASGVNAESFAGLESGTTTIFSPSVPVAVIAFSGAVHPVSL